MTLIIRSSPIRWAEPSQKVFHTWIKLMFTQIIRLFDGAHQPLIWITWFNYHLFISNSKVYRLVSSLLTCSLILLCKRRFRWRLPSLLGVYSRTSYQHEAIFTGAEFLQLQTSRVFQTVVWKKPPHTFFFIAKFLVLYGNTPGRGLACLE